MIYVVGVLVLLWAVTGYFAVRFQADARHYHELVERARQDLVAYVTRIEDAEDRHMEIEASLREQIQHLAERLSTLRIENGARPEQDRFEPTPKPPEPYSQQLTSFLHAIEYEDSRQLVIDDIERLRQENYSDEQIYDILNQ